MGEQASLPPLTTPKFVTFPVAHDPNFGDTDTHDVDSDPLWKEAAVSVVNDPEDTRQKRLEELRDELKRRSIKLCPGDKNQLLAMLRAGQGQVARALHVIEVFLQYQQYEKNGMLEVCYVSMLCKHYVHQTKYTMLFLFNNSRLAKSCRTHAQEHSQRFCRLATQGQVRSTHRRFQSCSFVLYSEFKIDISKG